MPRSTTYSKYVPGLAEAVDLQALLDQLGDFLLQPGFAGGGHPFWGDFGEPDDPRSMDAHREALLDARINSGQRTPEMLKVLGGDSTGNEARDQEIQQELAALLDQVIQRLIDEGLLTVKEPPKMPEGHQPVFGPGGQAAGAAQQVQFDLTTKGMDFLGYKTLKDLLGSIGKSSFGSHDTPYLATGV
jgi:Ca-activated chloride channel family protein